MACQQHPEPLTRSAILNVRLSPYEFPLLHHPLGRSVSSAHNQDARSAGHRRYPDLVQLERRGPGRNAGSGNRGGHTGAAANTHPYPNARTAADTEVIDAHAVVAVEGGAQQAVPEAEEQGEVHVSGAAVLHVVEAVHRRPGKQVPQRADARSNRRASST